ncbi:hypothetical protein IW261DRAFT_1317937, partial [Armillaria novae-zelandiae]
PYTPVHRPEQHQQVNQPPPNPHPLPPSPCTPLVHQPERLEQSNEHHLILHACANKERDEMKRCLNECCKANCCGDHTAAKDFSKQGKKHKQKIEQLNTEASDWIYHSQPGEIDLHCLHVKEAIVHTNCALKEAKRQVDTKIKIIVGKGLHSEGQEARVRPAIKGLMCKYHLVAKFDPSNSGILVIKLN